MRGGRLGVVDEVGDGDVAEGVGEDEASEAGADDEDWRVGCGGHGCGEGSGVRAVGCEGGGVEKLSSWSVARGLGGACVGSSYCARERFGESVEGSVIDMDILHMFTATRQLW